ncbi:ABC transporter permease [Anaerocaecibacter muris]|uniref:ABC transporter permease n=1 Tax=Anaerocaecibacter muris TaxID=2941513 RepID=UPI00203BFDC6|nr:ABC transporter permease subunit [Anaerocaecibacter muris]
MNKRAKRWAFNALYVAAVVAVALGVWAIAAAAVGSEFVLPEISTTLSALRVALKSADFWSGLFGTVLRSVIGYFISLGLFFIAFFLSTAFYSFARIVEPIISALRSLPAVAVTLILTLAVGAHGTPVVLGVLVIFPILYSSAKARTATVPAELVEVCRICGAGKIKTFTSLWLPCLAGALPESLATAFSYNIKAVIGAEILAQTAESLGMLMKLAQIYLEPALLIAYVIAAVAVAVLCECVIRGALKIVLRKYSD